MASNSPLSSQSGSSCMSGIDIRFIAEGEQRVPGAGDWWQAGEVLHVRAVQQDSEEETFLLALHEMLEAYLCRANGILAGTVDSFDEKFEREREKGKHGPDDEPGDDPRAPYRKQHRFACLVEFLTAHELRLKDYGVVR